MAHIIDRVPEVEREAFNRLGYTIGGIDSTNLQAACKPCNCSGGRQITR